MLIRITTVFCLILCFACTPKLAEQDDARQENPVASGTVVKVAYDEQAELAPGQSLEVPKTKAAFTFTKMVTDSRCPTGLDCFQAGEAVLLVTTPSGSAQTVRIPADARRKVTFGIPEGLVTVQAINPYPTSKEKTAPGDYRLVVKISKAAAM